jgi:hypothetical protein
MIGINHNRGRSCPTTRGVQIPRLYEFDFFETIDLQTLRRPPSSVVANLLSTNEDTHFPYP